MGVLEALQPDVLVRGLLPGEAVTIVAVVPAGKDAVRVVFRTAQGTVHEQLVYRFQGDELEIIEADASRAFDADGRLFRLAAEARRIQLAYLFDSRLAVHLSRVEPLPHQIQAVYGEMLPRQPLRFLLADDPGAGKTIMAGLYIKELTLRGDLRRCLVVAPGSLVAQWQDELYDKFALEFSLLTNADIEASRTGNPFDDRDLLIARLDHLARNDDLVAKLRESEWDLAVVDEAHRMAAHRFNGEVKETKRYQLGKALGGVARHLLLMTATPHAGKEDDFQLFLALLDGDRFEGRPDPDGAHVADVDDLMRRMTKEKLLRFDGTPLFPPRFAYTVAYQLSPPEMALYDQVTAYVAEEMGRAQQLRDQGDGRRGNRVGFAATVLQRRLASSPEAIYQSLHRRRRRLEDLLAEVRAQVRADEALARVQQRGAEVPSGADDSFDLDDLDAEEQERLEEEVVDAATHARTIAELEIEIASLARLEEAAEKVRRSGTDRKWSELSRLLEEQPELRDAGGGYRKLIIFSEHRDTLNYLCQKLRTFVGDTDAVVAIHGGIGREERKAIQERFTNEPGCRILVATDAAGEGINLQRAHLLINYDLPWNPTRIEQRFGRVHRIGQAEVCHMWNLVADDTREGAVYRRLLDKLNEMREALGKDNVFDILGDAISERELRGLLIEAIRFGDRPDVKARLREVIDAKVGEGLAELVHEHALASEVLSTADLQRIRADMLEAEARRLQPGYVQAWFLAGFEEMGGRIVEREAGRFEIPNVPADLRRRDRAVGGGRPLAQRYQRVTFAKELLQVDGKPPAQLLAPDHPLMQVTLDLVLERFHGLLQRGTVLVDPDDDGTDPRLLVFCEQTIADARQTVHGNRRVVSRRFEFVEVPAGGEPRRAGYAPYLDCRPPTDDEHPVVERLLTGHRWPTTAAEEEALAFAVDVLAAEHLAEVRTHTLARVRKVQQAVHRRLTDAARYWEHRGLDLKAKAEAGKVPKMNPDQAFRRADDLQRRLRERMAELDREAQLAPQAPLVVGAAIVVPVGALAARPAASAQHALTTEEVAERAYAAVIRAERWLQREPEKMPHNNPGYDIRSTGATTDDIHFIEVKGRVTGADTFVVTQNELRFAANVPDTYVLALVEVNEQSPQHDAVRYLRHPYGDDLRLPFDTTCTTLNWKRYWERGTPPS
jgi:superfamily II DNA or RNA helicase